MLASLQQTPAYTLVGYSGTTSYGPIGTAAQAASLMFEATHDIRFLDAGIMISDQLLAMRNNLKTGRVRDACVDPVLTCPAQLEWQEGADLAIDASQLEHCRLRGRRGRHDGRTSRLAGDLHPAQSLPVDPGPAEHERPVALPGRHDLPDARAPLRDRERGDVDDHFPIAMVRRSTRPAS